MSYRILTDLSTYKIDTSGVSFINPAITNIDNVNIDQFQVLKLNTTTEKLLLNFGVNSKDAYLQFLSNTGDLKANPNAPVKVEVRMGAGANQSNTYTIFDSSKAYVTSDVLSGYLRVDDFNTTIAGYAKLTDLAAYVKTTDLNTTLGNYVTTTSLNSQLTNYALKSDLVANYATKNDLLNYAKLTDLNKYVLTTTFNSTLNLYALKTDLNNYASTSDLNTLKTSLSTEGINLQWHGHFPSIEVAYGLPKQSLQNWTAGQTGTTGKYWLWTDGTVWAGVGTLGASPTSPFYQVKLVKSGVIQTYASTATAGQPAITIPYAFTTCILYINGVRQNQDNGAFTISGNTLVLSENLKAGDDIFVYLSVSEETLVQDKTVKFFSTTATAGQTAITIPYTFGSVILYINGVAQNPTNGAYSVTGSVITVSEALDAGDDIFAVVGTPQVASADYVLRTEMSAYVAKAELSGASRPANAVVGQMFFDTNINKPIWLKTAPSTWVDSTGTTV